jgi:hypothetical protein
MRIRINDSNDGAVSWRIFPFERKTRLLTSAPKDQLPNSGTYRIYGNHGLPGRLKIFVQSLNDKKLATIKAIVLHGRDHSSDNTCQLHSSRLSAVLCAAISADMPLDYIDENVQSFIRARLCLS